MSYRVKCRMVGSEEFTVQAVGFEAYDDASMWAQDVLDEGTGLVGGYLIEVEVNTPGAPAWRPVVKVELGR